MTHQADARTRNCYYDAAAYLREDLLQNNWSQLTIMRLDLSKFLVVDGNVGVWIYPRLCCKL